MPTRRAEQSYRERVARVVAFIVARPMAEHRLEDLAAMANFSPYHFHRVYSGVAGESVSATVRRVRLALATRLLAEGKQSVTQVALAVGYDSPQAFTRAFGQFTGQSPRAFQQHMHHTILDAGARSPQEENRSAPPVQIIERPAQQVHAMRHHGPLSTIPHTQRRFQLRLGANAARHWFGASYGDPEDSASFRYYAAAELAAPLPGHDHDIEVLEIPAGRYARHRLAGPYARINAAVNSIYTRWLPGSGYEPDDRPALEHYLNSPRDTPQARLITDLLIPIRSTTTP